MAKTYDEKEIENLERQAALKQRQDAAMKILKSEGSDPIAAMSRMTSSERQDFLRNRERQRTNDWHEANAAARERRLDAMEQIAAREPGRYSAAQVEAATNWLNQSEQNRRFDEGQQTARIKAREHANGLINQGKTQAEIKAAAEREISRNKDGWWDDQGNFHPGASVKAAEATGQWKSDLNESNWQHRKDMNELREDRRDNRQQQQIDAGREKTDAWRQEKDLDRQATKDKADTRMKAIQKRRDQQDALAEQRDFEKFLTDGFYGLSKEEKSAFRKMSPDEQKAFWKKKVGRETGEEENPNIQTDKQGVKWEIVFDSNGNKIGRKRVK